MPRWCIYIDILGFSELWESDMTKALTTLRKLMWAIHQIGTEVYPDPLAEGDRLFVHQIGDGFAIVSDFHEESLERPISIAIALMRYVSSATGNFVSTAIAEGEFSDIQGCAPEQVRRHSNNGTVRLGSGIMTLFSVMGTAFIRAHKLANKIRPSWPFLILPKRDCSRVPSALSVKTAPNNILAINWIEGQTPLLTKIQEGAGLGNLLPCELMQKIEDYNRLYPDIIEKWNPPLCHFLNLRYDTHN